jgi:hypothetical protein
MTIFHEADVNGMNRQRTCGMSRRDKIGCGGMLFHLSMQRGYGAKKVAGCRGTAKERGSFQQPFTALAKNHAA